MRPSADGQAAVEGLAAGHGDGVVVEDLVGDVDAGCDGGADGEGAGVDVGAVAEVLEDVVAVVENGASPIQLAPSPPIWVKPSGVAVHPLGHVVAADAGIGAGAFGHPGRGRMRAAGAEIGHAQ